MSHFYPLKVLLINDAQDIDLGTKWLEVMEVENNVFGGKRSKPMKRLGAWTQHMYLIAEGKVPRDFDLLLIDINFKDDGDAPPYPTTADPQTSPPWGLLHAIDVIASRRNSQMPLVFQIHSAYAQSLKDDGVARWAFGVIAAHNGDVHGNDPADNLYQPTHERVGKALATLPFRSPRDSWRVMLPKYRKELLLACDNGVIQMDPAAVAKCVSLAGDNTTKAAEQLGDVFLEIEGERPYYRSVRSLFADIDDWTPQNITQSVLPTLVELHSAATPYDQLYDEILKALTKIKINDDMSSNDTIIHAVKDAWPRSAQIRYGAMLFAWLEFWHGGVDAKIGDLTSRLGYAGESNDYYNILKRIIGKHLGYEVPPESHLIKLQTERLKDGTIRAAGQRYWEKLCAENPKPPRGFEEPVCIREPLIISEAKRSPVVASKPISRPADGH